MVLAYLLVQIHDALHRGDTYFLSDAIKVNQGFLRLSYYQCSDLSKLSQPLYILLKVAHSAAHYAAHQPAEEGQIPSAHHHGVFKRGRKNRSFAL